MVIGGAAQVAINNMNNLKDGGIPVIYGYLIGGIIGLIITIYFIYDDYRFKKWLNDPINNRRDWWNVFNHKE